MANLTPNEYFKIEGPIRSSRLRYQETDSFDDKTGKDIPASVDFVGQNDRVIFLSMNKKGEVRIMTFKIVNKEGTITKPEDVIDSIKNDSDFPGADITDYVKKILGKKYEDILTEDPTKADQFITKNVTNYNGVSKAFFVKNIEIIQTPWDPNVVPTQPTGPPPVENKSVTTTEPTVATSSVVATASNVADSNVGTSASNVGATASNIVGEFTFNVEQDNTFIGVNNQFGTLYTIGIGEIKEEPIDKPEEGELLEEEGLDEEYSEVAYEGPEEGAMAYPAAQVYQNNLMDSKREPDEKTTGGGKVISSTKFNGTPGAKLFKGHVKKDMLDDRALFDIMIKAIEGGYYHPTHLPGNAIMANSGETLWGIDRYASTNENTDLGQKFWRIVDKLSGYGDLSGGGSDFNNSHNWAKDVYGKIIKRLGSEGNPAYYNKGGVILQGYIWGDVKNQPYARIHSTSKWDFKKRPPKSAVSFTKNNGVWGHCYSPNEKDYPNDYQVLRDAALEFGNNTKKANFDAFFKGYDELVNLINNDGRLKFLWLRSCWNGSGFFKHFAAGVKKAWDSGIKNADDLIVYDLNNRLVYASGLSKVSRGLITNDSQEIAGLIGL